MKRLLIIASFFALTINVIAKPVRITFTGSFKEPITLKFGDTGFTTIVNTLPTTVEFNKEQLPIEVYVESENYKYYNINIPRKPVDDIGHYYIIKIDEDATNQRRPGENINGFEDVKHQENTKNIKPQAKAKMSDIDVNIPVSSKKSPNTFAVIIANEHYQEEVAVDYAINDGETFAEYCQKTLGLPEKNIHLRKDASLNNIMSELDWMKKISSAYGEDASFIFYYSGHGIPDEATGDAYLLPIDGNGKNINTGLSTQKLYSMLGDMSSKSTHVFMDACFSGSKRGDGMLVAARGVAVKARPVEPKGKMIVMSAAQSDETAYPFKEKEHGLFTYYLLKKLQETKGEVTMDELSQYVTKYVARASIVENGKSQTPSTSTSGFGDAWKNLKLK